MMMGVDILPSELPREASMHFGTQLLPFVEALATDDGSLPFGDQTLPLELQGACITDGHGGITPDFAYINKMRGERSRNERMKQVEIAAATAGSTALYLSGHLFDTGRPHQSLYLQGPYIGRNKEHSPRFPLRRRPPPNYHIRQYTAITSIPSPPQTPEDVPQEVQDDGPANPNPTAL